MAFTFDMYRVKLDAKNAGRARKSQSDEIMLNTWWEDTQAQVAYCYDYSHDIGDERFKFRDLHPSEDVNKTPVDIKFIRHESQSLNKDPVTFWLQLKPGQECALDYYPSVLGEKYGATWPVATYWDIMAEDGKYNKWLCVNTANYWGNQFPTYQLLPVDYLFQWIYQGKKYQCPGVLSSQNSYNSGLWTDYKITSVEDQQKGIFPMCDVTETIFYNLRMIIDTKLNTNENYRAWVVSKINRISPKGICNVTYAQDKMNQYHDYIEKDNEGNIIGMWADYWTTAVEPVTEEQNTDLFSSITSRITSPGASQIRVGGSKTLTITYYEDDTPIDHDTGQWTFSINGDDASDLLTVSYPSANKVKVKFNGGDDYIGSILNITNTSEDGITSSIDVEIIAF